MVLSPMIQLSCQTKIQRQFNRGPMSSKQLIKAIANSQIRIIVIITTITIMGPISIAITIITIIITTTSRICI